MPESKLSNERMQQIAEQAAAKLPELLTEREDDILRDFHDAVQQAHDDEAEKLPHLKLALAIDYDLQTNVLNLSLKWTVQRKVTEKVQLDDPNQSSLNLG